MGKKSQKKYSSTSKPRKTRHVKRHLVFHKGGKPYEFFDKDLGEIVDDFDDHISELLSALAKQLAINDWMDAAGNVINAASSIRFRLANVRSDLRAEAN